MKSSHLLAISALITVGLISWSLREILVQIFAGIVLAMALCTLVGKLRAKRSMPRPIALGICLTGLITIFSLIQAVPIIAPHFPPFLGS